MEVYAKKVKLTHGVILGDKVMGRPHFTGAAGYTRPYTHRLIKPYRGLKEVTVTIGTVGDVLKSHARAREEASPGTSAYNHAIARHQLKMRIKEGIEDDFFDEVAGRDYDDLTQMSYSGLDPQTGKTLFPLDTTSLPDGHTLRATVRLHSNRDRDDAEVNMRSGNRIEDPIAYQAQLAHLVTHFGPGAPSWDVLSDSACLHTLTYPDLQAILAEIFARDYEPLATLLSEMKVEVDGESVPFQDIPAKADKKGKGKG